MYQVTLSVVIMVGYRREVVAFAMRTGLVLMNILLFVHLKLSYNPERVLATYTVSGRGLMAQSVVYPEHHHYAMNALTLCEDHLESP